MDGDIDLVAVLIFDAQELAFQPFQRALDQTRESPDTIIHMHDPVARMQVRIGGFRGLSTRSWALARLRTFPAEDFGISDQ